MANDIVKYIPVPTPDLLDRLESGTPADSIKVMPLNAPDTGDRAFKELKNSIEWSNNKDELADRYRTFTNLLKKGNITVKLTGNESGVNQYALLLAKIADKHQLIKCELVELAALFEWTTTNSMALMKVSVSRSELSVMKRMVATGGMDIHNLAAFFNISMSRFSSWEFTSRHSSWASDPRLRNIRLMTSWLPARYKSEYYDDSIWMMPRPNMIVLVLDSESVSTNEVRQLGTASLPEDHTIFSISTAAESAAVMALHSMMETGVLVNGKTKVTASVIKKVSETLTLPQLPVITSRYDNSDIAGILAHLMLLGKHEKGNFSIKAGLQGMTQCLRAFDPQFGNFMLSRSLSSVPPSLRYIFQNEGPGMFAALQHVNSFLPCDTDTWYDMKSFRESVILRLASMGHGFAPHHFHEWLGKLRLEDGFTMPPSEIKPRLFDILLDSVILSFAAMGGYELLVSDGKAIGLRITRLGRWLVDPKSRFPESENDFNKEDDFEIDDRLMLIRVKNPSSPFLTTLKEFADPVMANRYRISDAKLLKGCQCEEDLTSRIKQLEDFVIGTPGPYISEHFKKLAQRFKSIVPTAGGTAYRLFDIRSDDRSLLRILTEDPDIVHNSLRVEGCRMLIKSNFLPKFIEKLRNAGYPVII